MPKTSFPWFGTAPAALAARACSSMAPAAMRQLLPPAEEVLDGPYDLRALRCAAGQARPPVYMTRWASASWGTPAFPLRRSAGH